MPAWFMRQAGRSLPEYRAIRGSGSILDLVKEPEAAAEITLQPVRRYGVDAAIIYSDIMVPVAAVGFGIEVTQGRGPVVAEPFTREADLARLRPLEAPSDVAFTLEAIKMAVAELESAGVPLIGFAGAPFTVASYLVEGGPSSTYVKTKTLMWDDPPLFGRLLAVLAQMALDFARAQVGAGAAAVQLFDSWTGALSPGEYERFVLPHTRSVMEGLADLGVPLIHFGVGASHLMKLMAGCGCDVLGVDWRMPLGNAKAVAASTPGGPQAVQGNLDPVYCIAPWKVLSDRALAVLREGGGIGHVFNLGHGVLPGTDPGMLSRLVELVHSTDPAVLAHG